MKTIVGKSFFGLAICLLYIAHVTESKHTKKGNHNIEQSNSTHKLGFKPLKPLSNTHPTKAKGFDQIRVEYNRLRLSKKHGHKIHRKNDIGKNQETKSKRGRIEQKQGNSFHLATEESIKDERAAKRFMDDGHHLDERPILGRCDINKQCKADQYCEGTYCFKCRKEDEHCYANGQCCKGAECQYGYCAGGVSAGMPGTFCDKAKDCKGGACCILEMSVDHHNPICKPMLEEHETCGPINLFHQICSEYRAQNEPICGPCKPGLACKSVGINGHHSVCLPEGSD